MPPPLGVRGGGKTASQEGRSWLVRMVQMLTRLEQSLQCEVGDR